MEVVNSFTNVEGVEATLKALKILKSAMKKEFYVFDSVYNVLTNSCAIQGGIALEGAKAILNAGSERKAYCISLVARDERIIQAGIVLNAVKIISLSNDDELLHYNKSNISYFIAMKLGINISDDVNAKSNMPSDYIDSLIRSLDKQPSESDIKVKKLTKEKILKRKNNF